MIGWFIKGTAVNVVALNEADHVLHLLSGAVLVGVATATDQRTRSRI